MAKTDRGRVRFHRHELDPESEAPTQVLTVWEVTLDDKKVGQLRKLCHHTARRSKAGEPKGWRIDRVECAYFDGPRGKKADLPGPTMKSRKLGAIAAVRERVLDAV